MVGRPISAGPPHQAFYAGLFRQLGFDLLSNLHRIGAGVFGLQALRAHVGDHDINRAVPGFDELVADTLARASGSDTARPLVRADLVKLELVKIALIFLPLRQVTLLGFEHRQKYLFAFELAADFTHSLVNRLALRCNAVRLEFLRGERRAGVEVDQG